MSHLDPVRKDKTCLNCRYVVEDRYCGNCGQENTDSRKSFHQLFVHFFEDLTHYENAFWKTIRHLVTKPGRLTKEYLSGKRLSYLAPIRLYIFISFVTFLLVAIVPSNNDSSEETHENTTEETEQSAVTDSIKAEQLKGLKELKAKGLLKDSEVAEFEQIIENGAHASSNSNFLNSDLKTVKELDSVQKATHKYSPTKYWFYRRYLEVTSNNTEEEMWRKFGETFFHNFPKVLFIYMPIFAFFLWLFQDKKKWYYFDHGIFTLHYFSFLLLSFLVMSMIDCVFSYMGDVGSNLTFLLNIPIMLWFFYYFFPAHHRFYGESRSISFVKSVCLLFVNSFIVSILLTIYAIYTFLFLH